MTFRNDCSHCSIPKSSGKQFWHLTGYYGISGTFCSDCYDLVSHDAYHKPKHSAYTAMRIIHGTHSRPTGSGTEWPRKTDEDIS